MADYQEYRRRVLHKRWRRRFIAAALLFLAAFAAAVGVLWRTYHQNRGSAIIRPETVLRKELTGDEWNTVSYVSARQLTVMTGEDGATMMDFRLAAVDESEAVDKSFFDTASFLGDSLTQGMQMYDTGLPNAKFCAYKGVGPNAVVNGTTCRRADGVEEIPMEALTAQAPQRVYVLLGTNVLNKDTDYSSFLTYYRLMLDMIQQALPNATVYVQSITPVRPEVSAEANHAGLNRDRLCKINDELAALAIEKNCRFINLWEALADENGDLIADYAQPDGYHLKPAGYEAWVNYLRTHTGESNNKTI